MDLRYDLRRGFVYDVLLLSGGAGLARALVVIAAPIISRLYSPSDFGALAVYVSIVTFVAVVASLRYEAAIPLPGDDETAANLTAVSLVLVGFTATLTCFVTFIAWNAIARALGAPNLGNLWWLLPIGLLATGLYQVLAAWAIRGRSFRVMAEVKPLQSVVQVLLSCTIGFVHSGPVGLVTGDAAGRLVAGGRLAMSALWRNGAGLKGISPTRMCFVARRYRSFPLLSSGSALVNGAGLQLPLVLVVMWYGLKEGGSLAFAHQMLTLPMLLLGHAVGHIYHADLSEMARRRDGEVAALFFAVSRRLLWFGALPVVVVMAWGPELFVLVFGATWLEAGVYARGIAIMYWAQLVAVPLSSTLSVLERLGWQLWWDIGRFLLVIGTLVVAKAAMWPVAAAVIAYGCAGAIAYAALYVLVDLAIRRAEVGPPRVQEHAS